MLTIQNFKIDIEGLEKAELSTGPILLFILIKYRDEADYSDHPDEEPCSGRDAHMRYLELVKPAIGQYNSKLIYRGFVKHILVGIDKEDWDIISIMEWDSATNLKAFMQSPEVVANRYHLYAGVENFSAIVTEKV